MPKLEIPTYAIAELLIRMAAIQKGLGEYCDHQVWQNTVSVTTTNGKLDISKELIFKQVIAPDHILDFELAKSAFTFQARRAKILS